MMNCQVIKPRNHSEQLATPRFLMLPISSDSRSSGHSVIIFPKNEEKNTAQISNCAPNCLSELDSVRQFVYHSITLSLLLYVIICLKLYFHFLFAKMVKKLSIDQKKLETFELSLFGRISM